MTNLLRGRVCIAVLIYAASVCAADDALIMPQDLVQAAQEHDCSQIEGFFSKAGAIDPPYVYGYLDGERDESAVFWCRKHKPQEPGRPYMLVVIGKNAQRFTCPTTFDWGNPPRGLSLYRDNDLFLTDFSLVRNPETKGPKRRVKGTVIVSSYDGVEEYFYCDGGNWWYMVRH